MTIRFPSLKYQAICSPGLFPKIPSMGLPKPLLRLTELPAVLGRVTSVSHLMPWHMQIPPPGLLSSPLFPGNHLQDPSTSSSNSIFPGKPSLMSSRQLINRSFFSKTATLYTTYHMTLHDLDYTCVSPHTSEVFKGWNCVFSSPELSPGPEHMAK